MKLHGFILKMPNAFKIICVKNIFFYAVRYI